MNKNHADVIIIGGGFYGAAIALFMKNKFKKVIILEKESDLLTKASYNNQARVHNGYHYPRSFITALRSHANYARFIKEFKKAITNKYTNTYAIANLNSKVSASQFVKFCNHIGSPIKQAPDKIKKLFNDQLIEDVFLVDEVAFNAAKLREILKNKLAEKKVEIKYANPVIKIKLDKGKLKTYTKNGQIFESDIVFNCTYANINEILKGSHLPEITLKHELTEMPLIKLPKELFQMTMTIMDGPFFSVMPFPDKKLHTIHHVRYTPIDNTLEGIKKLRTRESKFLFMKKDAQRYVPFLSKAEYKGSIIEVKTILVQNEATDARPILFKKDYGFKNFHLILGGKIDNIYDIVEALGEEF